jgi:hypothetical protein
VEQQRTGEYRISINDLRFQDEDEDEDEEEDEEEEEEEQQQGVCLKLASIVRKG